MADETRESNETVVGKNVALRPDQIAMLARCAEQEERSVSWLLRQIIDASPQMRSFRDAVTAVRQAAAE